MWHRRTQRKQPTIFLVVDDTQAALITWDHDYLNDGHGATGNHATHPFIVHSYEALPTAWFLHGVPWHMSSFTTYLQSYVQQNNLKKPLLICACSGDNVYEKTVNLSHAPTQAAIPPDTPYAHYVWHATSLPTQTHSPLSTTLDINPPTPITDIPLSTTNSTTDNSSYLVSGMPHSDVLRLRLCADKSGCTLHRVTTIRASMQPLYTYCQQHGITPENTHLEKAAHDTSTHETIQHATTSPDTLLGALCAPLPETHNRRLVLSALGLSLFERKRL